MEGGKIVEEDVSKLHKKKTIYTSVHHFPYVSNRSPVSQTEEVHLSNLSYLTFIQIIVSPLECAIESMQERFLISLFHDSHLVEHRNLGQKSSALPIRRT